MDRLTRFSTVFLVVIVVGLTLHEWTDWSNWVVALVTASVALLAGHLTKAWWTNYALKHHWTIYTDE